MSIEIDDNNQLAPRHPQVILEELNDLEKIEVVLCDQTVNTASHNFRLRSLAKKRLILQEEFYAAQLLGSNNDMEFSFDGDAVQDHTIEADFLGVHLIGLQEVIDKVMFAAGAHGIVSKEIPDDKRFESKMRITGWRASSFTVQFRLPSAEETGNWLTPDQHQITLKNIQELFDDETPEENLTLLIKNSGAKTAYKKLLQNMATHNTTVKVRTRVKPYSVRMSSETAAKRSRWMEISEGKKKDKLKVTGILIGGNIDTHKFTIKTRDASYSGTVSPDAYSQIRGVKLGSQVNALIKEIKIYKTKAKPEPNIIYRLESIFEAPLESKTEKTGNLFE